MVKEIIAYFLLFFGVMVAIIGTIYYLRMYKAMIGNPMHKSTSKSENVFSSDDKIQS